MLASSTPIDVVLVLTADQFHAEHVIASANAGKHVLIEKPMAQTEAEADAIEKARVDNGVVVFVGYMRRYATALERLKEAIKGKEIKCESRGDGAGRGGEGGRRTVGVIL
jgi:predicted dehydrogenase